MEEMQATHQHLFRYFLLHKVCSKEITLKFISQLLEIPDATDQDLKTCIEAINKYIKKFDLELVEGRSEVTEQCMVALVQVCSTVLSDCKTADKKTSLLFSKMLSKIVLSSKRAISETTAVNLSTEVDMSKTAVQAALQIFVKQLWFEEQDGMLYLGPRTIMELGSLLSSTYPENVKACSLCRNDVFYGNVCSSCQEKFHSYCLNRFFTSSKTCPSCKNYWDEETDLDESQSDGPTTSKRPRLISDSE